MEQSVLFIAFYCEIFNPEYDSIKEMRETMLWNTLQSTRIFRNVDA